MGGPGETGAGARGEVLETELTPVHQRAVSNHHGVCCIDRMCTYTCGELKEVADFEATANLQRGGGTPRNFLGAVMENGFHVYDEDGKNECKWGEWEIGEDILEILGDGR